MSFMVVSMSMLYAQEPPETSDSELKTRFGYSITILRDLNEKILALDHHLASISTHTDIMNLANPMNYPEFTVLREYVEKDLKTKHSLDIPEFLGQNAFFTGAWTLVSLVLTDKSPDEKTRALESVSCLLDFTLRIQNDLNVIYYEMDFLRETNDLLKTQCAKLFTGHTALIGYDHPLETCRRQDEWEEVFRALSATFRVRTLQMYDSTLLSRVEQDRTNMRFRVDLTVQFIQDYAQMIEEGVRHYQRFEKILSGYETDSDCIGSLPASFARLKEDVHSTLLKFQNAYEMPELFGSRLKMLMYGGTP